MIGMQHIKVVNLIGPVSVGTTEVTATFDTLGYRYASILLVGDTAAASSVITSCRVAEADSGTSYTAVTAFVGATATSTSAGFVVPIPNSSTQDNVLMNIDLRGRMRYLRLGFGSTTARIVTAVALLSRAKVDPATNALAGATRVNG